MTDNLYKVITCENTTELDLRATQLLREGWEPVGGVSCCVAASDSDYRYLWCQAFRRVEQQA